MSTGTRITWLWRFAAGLVAAAGLTSAHLTGAADATDGVRINNAAAVTAAADGVRINAAPASATPPAPPDGPIVVAGTCGQHLHPSTRYSEADWTVSCKNNSVTMAGWVRHFGGRAYPCAHATGRFPGDIVDRSRSSCGTSGGLDPGPRVPFTWSHPGSSVSGYLADTTE